MTTAFTSCSWFQNDSFSSILWTVWRRERQQWKWSKKISAEKQVCNIESNQKYCIWPTATKSHLFTEIPYWWKGDSRVDKASSAAASRLQVVALANFREDSWGSALSLHFWPCSRPQRWNYAGLCACLQSLYPVRSRRCASVFETLRKFRGAA